jgi:hypothetical protein
MTHTPTTAAIVTCQNFRFEDALGIEDSELITMNADTIFNGPSPSAAFPVTFARNATKAVKTAAVRVAINGHLAVYEPDVPPLTDLNIQITGMTI